MFRFDPSSSAPRFLLLALIVPILVPGLVRAGEAGARSPRRQILEVAAVDESPYPVDAAAPSARECARFSRWWRHAKPPPPAGCERITPFGALEWGDDLLTVIARLAERADVEEIRVGFDWYEAHALRDPEAALEAVQNACATSKARVPAIQSAVPGRSRLLCPGMPEMVAARSIHLAGQDFELRADFLLDGEAILLEADVPVTEDFYIPLGLSAVRLRSIDPIAATDRHRAEASCRTIAARVEDRYHAASGVRVQTPSSTAMRRAFDQVGTVLSVHHHPQCWIHYRSRSTTHRLARSALRYHRWAADRRREGSTPEY